MSTLERSGSGSSKGTQQQPPAPLEVPAHGSTLGDVGGVADGGSITHQGARLQPILSVSPRELDLKSKGTEDDFGATSPGPAPGFIPTPKDSTAGAFLASTSAPLPALTLAPAAHGASPEPLPPPPPEAVSVDIEAASARAGGPAALLREPELVQSHEFIIDRRSGSDASVAKAGAERVAKAVRLSVHPKDLHGSLDIIVHHALGSRRVEAAELLPLQKGAQLYRVGRHIEGHAVRRLPKGLDGGDVYFLRSDINDTALSTEREYIAGGCKNDVFCRLYLLWPSSLRVPKWVRTNFRQWREDEYVEVEWDVPLLQHAIATVLRRLPEATMQRLHVWQSNRVFGMVPDMLCSRASHHLLQAAGMQDVRFQLFGPGGSGEVTDKPFVTLFKFARDKGSMQAHDTDQLRHSEQYMSTLRQLNESMAAAAGAAAATSGAVGRMMRGNLLNLVMNAGLTGSNSLEELRKMSDKQWEDALRRVLDHTGSDVVRTLLQQNFMASLLVKPNWVHQIERVAINHQDVELMVLLYKKTNIEMSLKALAFLVHHYALIKAQQLTARQADMGGASLVDIDEFLVDYVRTHRNPISITAAICRAILFEMSGNEEARSVLRVQYSRFHSLHLELAKRLSKMTADSNALSRLEKILQPKDVPSNVTEVSALQVAFESHDIAFMSTPVVSHYTYQTWRGAQFSALTCKDDPRSVSLLNPLMGYRVLKNIGFAGSSVDFIIMFMMRSWHVYMLASTAFFNSPRGRWCTHAVCELSFLITYQIMVTNPVDDRKVAFHIVILIFVAGNLLDVLLYCYFKYGSLLRMKRYLKDYWNLINFFTNLALLALMVLKLLQDYGVGFAPYEQGDPIQMALATIAIFVWIRGLSMVVPVFPRLGPLLNTVFRMVEELLAFMFPLAVVMTGFSTTLTAVFSDVADSYSDFYQSIMSLFSGMLGNFNLPFQANQDVNLDNYQEIYGNTVLMVFLTLSAILMLNLLVAILTYHYRPEEVEAQTKFKHAQIVDYYLLQVKHNLICSPFSIVQVLLRPWPQGWRKKLHTTKMRIAGLIPVDGIVLPDDTTMLRTGRGEFPHLVYLCTLYPVIAVMSNALFYLYTPFAVLHFASKGYKKLRKAQKRSARVGDERSLETTSVEAKLGGTPWASLASQLAAVQQKEARWFEAAGSLLVQVLYACIMSVLGLVMYVGVFGLLTLTVWLTVYNWLGKVAVSLYSLLVRPWLEIARARRQKAAWQRKAATRQSRSTASQPAPGGHDAPAPAEEESVYKARWRSAIQKVLQSLHARYLSMRDIDKALERSKFASFRPRWHLTPATGGLSDKAAAQDDMAQYEMEEMANLERQEERGIQDGFGDDDDDNDDNDDASDIEEQRLLTAVLSAVGDLRSDVVDKVVRRQDDMAKDVRELQATVRTLLTQIGSISEKASSLEKAERIMNKVAKKHATDGSHVTISKAAGPTILPPIPPQHLPAMPAPVGGTGAGGSGSGSLVPSLHVSQHVSQQGHGATAPTLAPASLGVVGHGEQPAADGHDGHDGGQES